MSDTPETDALEQKQASEGCPQWNDMMRWVREHAALARELERERDELAVVCERYKQERDHAETELSKMIDFSKGALGERNEAREALQDMLSGWHYIRKVHGDLYGVGWDRAQTKAEKVLEEAK
jgi:uncharacterized coiled-coil DUF342 family protein